MVYFEGVYTAIISPFNTTGQLDLKAFHKIMDYQIEGGVAGVVVCGTTGESPALEDHEKKELVKAAIEATAGTNCDVLVGTGNNNTASSIQFSKWVSDIGASGLLVVTPYYSKPTQRGLINHFELIANAVDIPMVLYNVPGRTGVSLAPQSVAELAAHPRIAGLKDATGSLPYHAAVIDLLQNANLEISLLSGDDPTFLPFLAAGGHGAVSVASNIIPGDMTKLWQAAKNNQYEEARALNRRYFSLFRDLFIESNPGPVKYTMAAAGFCEPAVREPLAELEHRNAIALRETLSKLRIIDAVSV